MKTVAKLKIKCHQETYRRHLVFFGREVSAIFLNEEDRG
jgi:hypothetical protein